MTTSDLVLYLAFLAFTGWVLWLTFSDMLALREIVRDNEEPERRRRKPKQRL
jgi:hypothetical protein